MRLRSLEKLWGTTLCFSPYLKTDRITRDLICLCESEVTAVEYLLTLLIIFSVSFDLSKCLGYENKLYYGRSKRTEMNRKSHDVCPTLAFLKVKASLHVGVNSEIRNQDRAAVSFISALRGSPVL